MIAQLRSELFKQRTTRTARVLLASMAAVTLLVVCLHVFTLKSADLSQAANQPEVFGWATTIGALFAGRAMRYYTAMWPLVSGPFAAPPRSPR